MYLSYDEYLDLGGTLDETTFNLLEFEASAKVDYYTFNRLRNERISDKVKMAVMRIISLLEARDNAYTAGNTLESSIGIKSQSNDGVSIAYNGISATVIVQRTEDDIKATVLMYLSGEKNSKGHILTYRGLYSDE